jgi:hypothetical protein
VSVVDGGRIKLEDRLELELADGSVVRVQNGPYGKGIAIFQLSGASASRAKGPKTPGKRGRKPRPSTVALRQKMGDDQMSGGLKKAQQYVRWLLERDGRIGTAFARAVVYRELRALRN